MPFPPPRSAPRVFFALPFALALLILPIRAQQPHKPTRPKPRQPSSPMSGGNAIGATVYLTANGIRQREDVMSGGSFISSNDQRPHFGLGDSTDPGAAEIHWPSGARETIKLPAGDRIYTVQEGVGIVGALCGGKPCREPRLPAALHNAASP